MFKRESKTRQTIEVSSWVGTPPQLAHLGERMMALIDNSTFDNSTFYAAVASGGETLWTRNPLDLRDLNDLHRISHIEMRAARLDDTEGRWNQGRWKQYQIDVDFFRHSATLRISSPEEVLTIAMRVGMEEALKENRRALNWLYRTDSLVRWFLAGPLPVFLFTFLCMWVALGLDQRAFRLSLPPSLILALLLPFAAEGWLIPPIEFHEGKSRFQRFRWGVLTAALLPFLLSIGAALLVR